MRTLSKLIFAIAFTASAFSVSSTPLYAKEEMHKRLEVLEKRVSLLEKHAIVYGPISVSHIRFEKSKNYVIAAPGEKLSCSFHYKLDSSQQEFLDKHHLIVGLAGVAAEACVATLYGVWDSVGTARFDLTAPLEAGEYEVRIAYRPGSNCEEALNSWNVLEDEPGSFATIGFIRVVNPVSPVSPVSPVNP